MNTGRSLQEADSKPSCRAHEAAAGSGAVGVGSEQGVRQVPSVLDQPLGLCPQSLGLNVNLRGSFEQGVSEAPFPTTAKPPHCSETKAHCESGCSSCSKVARNCR